MAPKRARRSESGGVRGTNALRFVGLRGRGLGGRHERRGRGLHGLLHRRSLYRRHGGFYRRNWLVLVGIRGIRHEMPPVRKGCNHRAGKGVDSRGRVRTTRLVLGRPDPPQACRAAMGITGHLPAIPPQQTGRKLDGSAISRRVSGRRADAAGARSKSSLKGGHEDQRRAPEWPDVRAPSGRAKAKRWSPSGQDGLQFPLPPVGVQWELPGAVERETGAAPSCGRRFRFE